MSEPTTIQTTNIEDETQRRIELWTQRRVFKENYGSANATDSPSVNISHSRCLKPSEELVGVTNDLSQLAQNPNNSNELGCQVEQLLVFVRSLRRPG